MTIYCAVVGENESAFGIDIDEGKSVDQLKQAIKERNEDIHVPSHRLKLFLAKKSGVWLTEIDVMEDVSDTTDLELLEAGRATLRSVGLSDEDVGEVDEADAAAGEGPVNVLVVIPELYNVPSPVMALFNVMLPHVLTQVPTTESDVVIEFKMELCKFYECYSRHRTWVRCMLLDVAFPKSLVSASHLFRCNNAFMAPLTVQLWDIDDMRNGLLLFKPLKHAFDHFQLSFILDDTNVFRLKLFDPSIYNTRLLDLKDCDNENVLSMEEMGVLFYNTSLTRNPCEFDTQTTFGDVDGSALVFTGLKRPFYRCLNQQARLARVFALKKHWIDESYNFTDFWSEVSLDDKMDMFHRSILEN
ncbi:hypothetical protein DVH05_004688 [Phytophthora capsici]|nr:hypothetical protein DVH05_004723 [Phytophthora capsici]KAG1687658.1 hypothetical protein DVH05_004688 [Phytophthora capsici]|eukprot:jgi/Phyca11/540976/estExt2_Genewise1Plus.C_PHYCAscaffold_50927